jgi:hypothetical protein
VLLLHNLNGQNGIPRIFLDLGLHMNLSGATHNEKSGAGETGDDQNDGEQELSAKAKVPRGATQPAPNPV